MGDSHTLCWLRRSGEQTEVSFGILSSGRLDQSRLLLCAVKTRNLSKGFGVFLLTEAFRGDRQCSHPCPVTWEKQPSFHGAERLETPRSLPQQVYVVYVHCCGFKILHVTGAVFHLTLLSAEWRGSAAD